MIALCFQGRVAWHWRMSKGSRLAHLQTEVVFPPKSAVPRAQSTGSHGRECAAPHNRYECHCLFPTRHCEGCDCEWWQGVPACWTETICHRGLLSALHFSRESALTLPRKTHAHMNVIFSIFSNIIPIENIYSGMTFLIPLGEWQR